MKGRSVRFISLAAIFLIGVFALTGVALAQGGGLWQNAVDLGGGWEYLNWFGYFNTNNSPWIYHEQLGWLYPYGTSTDNIWFLYANTNVYLWTSKSAYPDFYNPLDDTWFLYEQETTDPCWFYNLSTNEWETPSSIHGGPVSNWTQFNFTVSDSAKAVFNTAIGSIVGVSYVPVAVATQVVEGTNYCFICEGKVDNPGAGEYFAKVYIYQPLSGTPTVTRIEHVQIAP